VTRRQGLKGLLVGLGLWVAMQPALAQTDALRAERQIKAAFLLKFLGFVDWPPPAFETNETPLRVGLVGADALADDLVQVARRRQINGRPVQVRKLSTSEPPTGLHALFIGRVATAQMADLLALARRQPLLLVIADADDATAQGAAIAFAVADDKVRFDVAPAAAEQAGLKISSRLMAVARRVVAP
jgi:hypothetical protein